MIIITGAAGFIGSCLLTELNSNGFKDLVLVDDFSRKSKRPNYEGKEYVSEINRDDFFEWLDIEANKVQLIFHLGARTDTTEFDYDILNKLNLEYSKKMFERCSDHGIPLIYASSAATYGLGENGFEDHHQIDSLKPLNPYGESKNEFDKWVLRQEFSPYFWVGLKFFNVFGPNEYHKGRMASVILHAYNQIKETNKMKLFRSHNPDFKDGEQLRDFIFVKDVVNVLMFFMHHRKDCGIYNLGTGKARTFNDLVLSTFKSMNVEPSIDYIDTPEDIRDKYQYYTEANMNKLKAIGYSKPFTSLENGVENYVKNYLMKDAYY